MLSRTLLSLYDVNIMIFIVIDIVKLTVKVYNFAVVYFQLSVRTKNTRERLGSLFKGFSKSIDESIVLKNQKEVDPWFESEKKFLDEYHVK